MNIRFQDFALEPDEQKMRRASQHMIRAMTAGMASITCREPLSSTILGFLKTAFTNSLRCNITPEQVIDFFQVRIKYTEYFEFSK